MKSHCPSKEDLAIYAGEGNAPGVTQSHLGECATCAGFIAALKEDRTLLQSMPDLPEAAYAQVRQRVLAQVNQVPSRRYTWVAAAIAAALLVAVFFPRNQPAAPQLTPPPQMAKAPLPEPLTVAKAAPVTKRTKAAKKPSSAALIAALDNLYDENPSSGAGVPGQVVITMETEDPNVTIILLGESTGDDE